MVYSVNVTASIETIKKEMQEHAKRFGFSLLNQYQFQELLASKGFPIQREITVFELCNPNRAQKALMAFPEISVYLPCRISVYEEDGTTVLSTIAIADMLSVGTLDADFRAEMREVFDNLTALIGSWES